MSPRTRIWAQVSLTVMALGIFLPLPRPALGAGGCVTGITESNGVYRVVFESSPGHSYQLQQLSSIVTRWWDDVGTGLVASTTETTASATTGVSCSYFRVLELTNSVFWYDWVYRYESPTLGDWGLGAAEGSYTHQDRPYEWYIDQADTGAANGNNCGPSSVTMAIKWHDESFSQTAEDARDWSYSWRANGWWYTSDITSYLTLYSIPYTTSAFTGGAQMAGLISAGKILILCMDTSYITYNTTPADRIDRFYSYGGGHFIVVKGARSVSGTLLFEVYDPNTWHAAYADGSPKGKNRHFTEADLAASITNWWSYLIVVDPAGGGGGKTKTESSRWLVPVDPATIEDARSGPREVESTKPPAQPAKTTPLLRAKN